MTRLVQHERARSPTAVLFFFFNDTATTEIYTLSLHDALPIWERAVEPRRLSETTEGPVGRRRRTDRPRLDRRRAERPDRKSTRLNSSHSQISYAVFCLKKKNNGATYSMRHADTLCHCASFHFH